MHKFYGYLLVSLTLLTTAIVLMFAQMSSNIDEIDGNYGSGIISQIPPLVFVLLFLSLCLGLGLLNGKGTFTKDKRD